jgi:pyrroloquinoline quinone (PQQ) biosynthesis protein C
MQIKITEHPQWVNTFLEEAAPHEENIVDSDCFKKMAAGELSIDTFRGIMVCFNPLIENFPKYMALILPKVPAGDTPRNNMARAWLIQNLNIERLHAAWYRDWIWAFGVSREITNQEVHLPPEMDAVNNYLWKVCTYGTLPEAIAALNYAIEGPTGIWTKRVYKNINHYEKHDGVKITRKSLAWLNAHARYDDHHPDEALEIIKAFATTEEEQGKSIRAVKNGMSYYAMAAKASYETHKNSNGETLSNYSYGGNSAKA